jgi:hypothetical protein
MGIRARDITTLREQAWAALIALDHQGKFSDLTEKLAIAGLECAASEPLPVPANAFRYKIQQNQGEYCLKMCDDGDLVDWSSYEALLRRVTSPPPTVLSGCAVRASIQQAAQSDFDRAIELLEQVRDGSEDEWPALNEFLSRVTSTKVVSQ